MNFKDYLNKKAQSHILNRGKKIYFKKGILAIYDLGKDIDYIVRGDSGVKYTVTLYNIHSNKVSSSCTCPYDYGGICKHTVAALLHFQDNQDKKAIIGKALNNAPKPSKKTGTFVDGKFVIDANFPLDYKALMNSVNKVSILRYGYRINHPIEFSKLDIKKQKITASIEYDYYNTEDITIQKNKDKLEFTCSCNSVNLHNCTHLYLFFDYIYNHNKQSIIEILDPDNYQYIISETAKDYNISAQQFKKTFKLYFAENEIAYKPIIEDTLILKAQQDLNEYTRFDAVLNPSEEPNLDLYKIDDTDKVYELGFIINFSLRNEILMPGIYFVAGIAPKNRANNLTKMQVYEDLIEDELDLDITPDLHEFNKLATYKKAGKSDFESVNDAISFFYNTFSEVFSFLQDKEFIYYMEEDYDYGYGYSKNKIKKKDLTRVTLSDTNPILKMYLSKNNEFTTFELKIFINDEEIYLIPEENYFIYCLFIDNQFYLIKNLQDCNTIFYFYKTPKIQISNTKFDEFFEKFVKPLSQKHEIIYDSNFNVSDMNLKNGKKQIFISEMNNFILFKPVIHYKDLIDVEVLKDGNPSDYKQNKILNYKRETKIEQEFIEVFRALHPSFKNQFRSDFFHLNNNEFLDNYWFYKAFETLNKNKIEVFGIEKLKNFNFSKHTAKVSTSIKSNQDWFDVNVDIKFGDFQVSLKEVQKALMRRENFVKLGNGTLGVLPEEWVTKFENYFRQGEIKKNSLKISKLRFDIVEDLYKNRSNTKIIKELVKKRDKLKNFDKIKNIKIPENLNATLRDYQISGYNWLNFLDEFKWGGILADDMGLGKTIQILAFLLKIKEKANKANLIILPTTLIFNWKHEIEKFAPSLSVFYNHGNNRLEDIKQINDYDLVITTYGLAVNDIELFKKYKFNYIILDESQAIKNPESKRFKAVNVLKADNKLTLTGTPIENNTFDLYAQMSFVNPGFLGTQKAFKDKYSDPIDKDRNTKIATELQQTINPFILRRTKEQVAKELPPKTEDFIYCIMEDEQRKVYDAFRNKYRNFLLGKIEEDGLGKSKMYVLEGLTKLRQICDSPAILNEEENYGNNSIKLKELVRHIQNKTAKHKILVFSQFVSMLKLIKKELQKNDIIYEYLDGQSSQDARRSSVENFQNNKNCRVFLISLKAGGTGLNLTAADYVYIFDPWWNPAVENQAIDRAYRIGQDKKVIAYRMICKNTIEEKIMDLQSKKLKTASDIIATEESVMKALDKNDITELFS